MIASEKKKMVTVQWKRQEDTPQKIKMVATMRKSRRRGKDRKLL